MLITFSGFTNHWASLKGRIAPHAHKEIGREALARVHARYAQGYADAPLNFADLCERLEAAL